MSSAPKKRGKTRKISPKGADTRRRLIEAAGALFVKKGIAASSLEEIAAAAGVTTGAIYDNFDGKDDLIFEDFKSHNTPGGGPAFVKDVPVREQLERIRDGLIKMAPNALQFVPVNAEFSHYLAAREPLRRRIADIMRQNLKSTEAQMQGIPDVDDLPLRPAELIVALGVLHHGLALQRLLLPDIITDEAIKHIYDWLLGVEDRSAPKKSRRTRST